MLIGMHLVLSMVAYLKFRGKNGKLIKTVFEKISRATIVIKLNL